MSDERLTSFPVRVTCLTDNKSTTSYSGLHRRPVRRIVVVVCIARSSVVLWIEVMKTDDAAKMRQKAQLPQRKRAMR